MECPNCHTWNPDDKRVCWRCQTELPKPVEKKKRTPTVILGLPLLPLLAFLRNQGEIAS